MANDKTDDVDPDDNMPDDDKDLQDAEALRDPPPYVAPSADEWERTTAALKKANNQARKLRQEKRSATTAAGKTPEEGTGSAADNAAAIAKAVADATSAASKKWAPRIVASAAKAALVAAGLTGAPDRVLKMIDHDDDIDDDGEVSGLDEQIAELKADYPELFAAKTKKPAKIDASRRTAAGSGKKKSSAEIIQERFAASA
jgi:hypothetical protein